MDEIHLNGLFDEFKRNLSFTKTYNDLDVFFDEINPKKKQFIKLYDTIHDACITSSNHNWYLSEAILQLNSFSNRPTGIKIRTCTNLNCTSQNFIISLIVNERLDTKFFRLSKKLK